MDSGRKIGSTSISTYRQMAYWLAVVEEGPLGSAFVDLICETPWPKPPPGALVIP